MNSSVAVLGLGAMGAPIAARLHDEGLNVSIYDPDPSRSAPLVDRGLSPTSSAGQAATAADVIILMVANEEQAADALFGVNGAGRELQGSTVVIMSTLGPEAVRGIDDQLSALGAFLVDAPVSGGVARAGNGTLLVMAAGCEAAARVASPILRSLGDPVVWVGSQPGVGQSVKLVNQLLCGVHIAAAAEAMAFASALGLDPHNVWEVIRRGAAASFMLEDRGRRMVLREFEPVNSAVDIFVKDLGLVQSAARRNGFCTLVAESAEQMFVRAAELGFGQRDDSEIINTLPAH